MLSSDQIGKQVPEMVDPEVTKSKMLPIGPEVVAHRMVTGKAFCEECDGQVVSFGTFDEMDECIEVRSVITREGYRNRGLATKICQKVISEAQRHGKPIVALCNNESRDLMRKLGFRLAEKTAGFPELWCECQSCQEHSDWPRCHCQYLQLFGKMHQKGDNIFSVINLSAAEDSDVSETARLYCEVWREPPWCEMDWQEEAVAADFRNYLDREGSIALVAVHRGKIVGFTSGWNIGPEEIAEKTNGMFGIAGFIGQSVYYIAELATGRDCRQTGIGKQLSLDLMAKARLNGANRFLLRTNVRAVAARTLYRNLGFTETEVADVQFADRTYWVL